MWKQESNNNVLSPLEVYIDMMEKSYSQLLCFFGVLNNICFNYLVSFFSTFLFCNSKKEDFYVIVNLFGFK
jgi:hypothetical protein